MKATRYVLAGVLAFGALNAIAGGYYGIAGAKGVPIEWLAGSPFRDYLIPSIILFFVVGGSWGVAAVAVALDHRLVRPLTMAAALVMLGWIGVQLSIIGYVSILQPICVATALVVLALATRLPQPAHHPRGIVEA